MEILKVRPAHDGFVIIVNQCLLKKRHHQRQQFNQIQIMDAVFTKFLDRTAAFLASSTFHKPLPLFCVKKTRLSKVNNHTGT